MKIDKISFILGITLDNNENVTIYLNQPLAQELDKISKILGFFYDKVTTKRLNFSVLIRDWREYMDDSLENVSIEKRENILKALDTFFDRILLDYYAIDSNGAELNLKSLNESELEIVKGHILFSSALYRYCVRGILTKDADLRHFFTSQSVTELRTSLQKQSAQSTEAQQTQNRKPLVK